MDSTGFSLDSEIVFSNLQDEDVVKEDIKKFFPNLFTDMQAESIAETVVFDYLNYEIVPNTLGEVIENTMTSFGENDINYNLSMSFKDVLDDALKNPLCDYHDVYSHAVASEMSHFLIQLERADKKGVTISSFDFNTAQDNESFLIKGFIERIDSALKKHHHLIYDDGKAFSDDGRRIAGYYGNHKSDFNMLNISDDLRVCKDLIMYESNGVNLANQYLEVYFPMKDLDNFTGNKISSQIRSNIHDFYVGCVFKEENCR